MLNEKNIEDLYTYKNTIDEQWSNIINSIDEKALGNATKLVLETSNAGGRIHVTGIGKPAHVGGYIASLISSTGHPCYELHGTEAVHGSSGQVLPNDVVIAISNSGETSELKATVTTLKNNGAKIIGVSGNNDSWLAKQSEIHLFAGVTKEGGPLNRAPRASIIAEIVVLQAFSVILQSKAEISPQQYVKWHPGGALGKLRKDEQQQEILSC